MEPKFRMALEQAREDITQATVSLQMAENNVIEAAQHVEGKCDEEMQALGQAILRLRDLERALLYRQLINR